MFCICLQCVMCMLFVSILFHVLINLDIILLLCWYHVDHQWSSYDHPFISFYQSYYNLISSYTILLPSLNHLKSPLLLNSAWIQPRPKSIQELLLIAISLPASQMVGCPRLSQLLHALVRGVQMEFRVWFDCDDIVMEMRQKWVESV